MSETTEINQGEIVVKYDAPRSGKTTFAELGLTSDQLEVAGGNLRLVFNFDRVGGHEYYQVPTIEVAYAESMPETYWNVDFNGKTIIEKSDHGGKSTVILLNRKVMTDLEQHHENRLVLHADFPAQVHLLAEESFVHFFK